jgi:hypothetical protein
VNGLIHAVNDGIIKVTCTANRQYTDSTQTGAWWQSTDWLHCGTSLSKSTLSKPWTIKE